jgi:hypothetical protein
LERNKITTTGNDENTCEACILGKMNARKFNERIDKPGRSAEIIASDTFKVRTETHDNKKIGLIYMDMYSDYWFFKALTSKNEQISNLKSLIPWIET